MVAAPGRGECSREGVGSVALRGWAAAPGARGVRPSAVAPWGPPALSLQKGLAPGAPSSRKEPGTA